MPSQVADDLWHEFTLHTRACQAFCEEALGRFFHHTPALALGDDKPSNIGLCRCWWFAGREDNIDPRAPTRLPLLFALDGKLDIPTGFRYLPNCDFVRRQSASTQGSSAVHCGGDFSSSSFDGSAIVMAIDADPRAEAPALSQAHVRRSRGEPGCLSQAVHRDIENPLIESSVWPRTLEHHLTADPANQVTAALAPVRLSTAFPVSMRAPADIDFDQTVSDMYRAAAGELPWSETMGRMRERLAWAVNRRGLRHAVLLAPSKRCQAAPGSG